MLSILVTSLLALPAADAVKAADNAMDAADFLGALKLLEGLDTGSATPLVLERAALLRAECLVTLQRPGEADAAYADAIRVNPNVQLGASAPAKLVAALNRVKEKLVGTLKISSNLNGAMALVDGRRVGPLPVSEALVAGKHQIQIDSDGAVVTEVVEVLAGRANDIFLEVNTRQTSEKVVVAPALEPQGSRKALPIGLIGGGGAVAVAGGILLGNSFSWNSSLMTMTFDNAQARHRDAELQHHLGIGALGVGAAAAVTGLAILLLGSSESSAVLTPVADGAILGIAGKF